MKISDRIFPYPVLSPESSDYLDAGFAVEHNAVLMGDSVQFDFELVLRCPAISRLIQRGAAEYAVHIECPVTSYRELLRGSSSVFGHVVRTQHLLGNVERVALVLAKEDIFDYDGDGEFGSDFEGLKYYIPRGGILAYRSLPAARLESQLTTDAAGPSIVVAFQLPETGDPPMRVQYDQDSIMIGLGADSYSRYVQMSADPGMQPILNSMLVLPAMIHVLEGLRDPEVLGDSQRWDWFQTLSRSAGEVGKDLEAWLREESDSGMSTVEMAQMLMDGPLQSALREASRLSFDPAEEEDT